MHTLWCNYLFMMCQFAMLNFPKYEFDTPFPFSVPFSIPFFILFSILFSSPCSNPVCLFVIPDVNAFHLTDYIFWSWIMEIDCSLSPGIKHFYHSIVYFLGQEHVSSRSAGSTYELDLVEGSNKTICWVWSFHQIQWVCSEKLIYHELMFLVISHFTYVCNWIIIVYMLKPCHLNMLWCYWIPFCPFHTGSWQNNDPGAAKILQTSLRNVTIFRGRATRRRQPNDNRQ